MYLTRAQFKNYKKICRKLRVPLNFVHLNKKTFLKLTKAKKKFHFVIQSTIKVCRKRVFICKSVRRVGSFCYPKDNKIKKKIIQLKMLELRICNELSKVNSNARLQKKNVGSRNSNTEKLLINIHECNQEAYGEVTPHITSEKDNAKGNVAEDIEYTKDSQNVAQTAVVNIRDDDDGASSSSSASCENGRTLREKILTQLELLRARKNDCNAFVSPVNDEQFKMNKKRDLIKIVEKINNQKTEQQIQQLDKEFEINEDNSSIDEKSAENDMAIVAQRRNKALSNKGIVDVLYSNFKIKKENVHRCSPTYSENIKDPSIKLLKNEVWDEMDDSSSSSSEFFGFDNDIEKFIKNSRHNPNLLLTPYVSKVRSQAAFLTDDININDITIEKHKEDTNAKKLLIISSDKVGLANETTIPKLTLPARPRYMDMEKPRTVAQKRVLLEGNEDFRYHMFENESHIYYHLNRRQKSLVSGQPTTLLQIEQISSIQKQNIPFTRDSWRALAWLRTENSNYLYRTVQWKGSDCKIIGSKGNHPIKPICFDSQPMKSVPNIDSSYCNCPEFPLNLRINSNTKSKIKPGPLSSKIVQYNKMAMDDENCLSTFHAYNMPQVQLKVFPKLNRPLDEEVKPFLKMIVHDNDITEEWAKYTVSTVITKSEVSKGGNESKPNEFSFTIPYQNNQEKILVCERKTHESLIPNNFNEKLSFVNDVAENDVLVNEIAQILTELTNSVVIYLPKNNCVQEYPDINYNQMDDNLQGDDESKINQKLMKKLKQLNAKIKTINEKKAELNKTGDDNDSKMIRKVLRKLKKLKAKIITAIDEKAEIKKVKDDNVLKIIRKVLKVLKKLDAKIMAIEERDFDCESEEIIQQSTMNSIPPVDTPKILEAQKIKVKVKVLPKLNAEFDHLRHVKVNMQRLPDISHIEPLCMVHWLYKCFCKNQSLSGEAFKFHGENDSESLVEDDIGDSNEGPKNYRKRRYTFERTNAKDSEYKKYPKIGDSRQIQTTAENNFTIVHDLINKNRIVKRNNKTIQATPISGSCVSRRVCPVNRKFYRARNLYSRERYITESKKLIGDNEVERKLLLEKRIQQSVDYSRAESRELRVNYPKLLIKKVDGIPIYINVCDTDEKIQSYPILRPLVNCNKVLLCIDRNQYILQLEENFDSFIRDILEITAKTAKSLPVCVIRRSQDTNDIKSTKDDGNKIINNLNAMEVLHLLKNFKINPNSNDNIVTSIGSLLKSLKERNMNGRDSSNPILFDNVYISNEDLSNIQTMNGRIWSTMSKIYRMIFRNSEHIPHPQKGHRFFLRWKYLLIAFEEQLINIYEYEECNSPNKKLIITQMEYSAEKQNFLRGCRNIRDLRHIIFTKISFEGSLISKMITGRIEGLSTKNLSLVLQGHPEYWIVCGFMNTERHFVPKSRILKPTPISHPRLSKKIALYYNLMMKNDEVQASSAKQKVLNKWVELPENVCTINAKDKKSTAASEVKQMDTSRRELLSSPELKLAMPPPRTSEF